MFRPLAGGKWQRVFFDVCATNLNAYPNPYREFFFSHFRPKSTMESRLVLGMTFFSSTGFSINGWSSRLSKLHVCYGIQGSNDVTCFYTPSCWEVGIKVVHVYLVTDLILTQECIPVGCVPAARRRYAEVSFPGGCAWSGGGCLPGLGGCGWSRGGWCAWSGGSGWSKGGGVPGPGGGWSRGGGWADPLPPVNRMNDRQV